MTSYYLYNFIVINLADISRFSNLVLILKVLTNSFPKMYICQFPSTEREVMASFVLSIVTIFQIGAYDVTCVYKLSKTLYHEILCCILRKVTKYELDTCTGSRVIKNFLWGGG